ncbi:hypothetical protein [Massilia haematophila]|uniref:Uncharacterized protein n=1 Tax=Massilia haematophila TaxID=457923 RepID=A0ABV7PDK8_9BURK
MNTPNTQPQQSIGAALQIDQATGSLRAAIDANAAAVRELIERITPLLAPKAILTGSISAGGIQTATLTITLGKAPLASALESDRDDIAALTKEVQEAISALQI